jgi:hypothetical protein
MDTEITANTITVDSLAEALQEPKRALLLKVLRTFGQDRCAAILADTLQCEANGGMLTTDGSRRRTPGGTFFRLVRERATPKERRHLFPRPTPQQDTGQPQPQQQPQGQEQSQPLTWTDVQTVIQSLSSESPGEARTMKLTLIGRPGKVETRGQAVVFRMQGKPPASLPRGLPPVSAGPSMTWNVLVALRQWNRVKDSLAANQDDQLIIEGYPMMQGSQPVLLVQSCASMLQQRAQKQAQRQGTETS